MSYWDAQDPGLASPRSGLYCAVPPALRHGELKCDRKSRSDEQSNFCFRIRAAPLIIAG